MMDSNLDKEEINLTWNKVERDLQKVGYREGISDGKESNFQKSFDLGYKEGLRNGFVIGKALAALQFSTLEDAEKKEPLLENPSGGWCQLCCSGNQSSNLKLSHIGSQQTDVTNNNLQKLHSLYGGRLKVQLPAVLVDDSKSES